MLGHGATYSLCYVHVHTCPFVGCALRLLLLGHIAYTLCASCMFSGLISETVILETRVSLPGGAATLAIFLHVRPFAFRLGGAITGHVICVVSHPA